MPMYDFYCSSCSCEFEDMVGPDEACPPCPNCGSADTERLLSAANLKHGAKPFKVDGRAWMDYLSISAGIWPVADNDQQYLQEK